MWSLLRRTSIAGAAVAATIVVGASTFAANGEMSRHSEVAFFQGVKTCSGPTAKPPQIVCRITTSSVAILEDASIAYTSVTAIFGQPAPGRVDSEVHLTTAATGAGQSTADGHCTFYFSTGSGVCIFTKGMRDLAGFHAVLAIGTVNANAGTYSAIGKYWLSDSSGD